MHLLRSDDLSKKQMQEIFSVADQLEAGKLKNPLKEHSTLAMLFSESSTRTRASFEVAIAKLGGSATFINTQTSQMKRGESLEDTARTLSLYYDFIAVRTNEHSDVVAMANASKIPVINALTHLEHPTQALADVYTILKNKGKIEGIRIAFVGDIAQNTANSLMLTATKLGAEVSLVTPKGCMPNKELYEKAQSYGKISISNSKEEGLKGADVIYTDTFVSMGDEGEASAKRKLYAPYCVDEKMLRMAKSDAIVMHPLPAHRGEEITAEVLDGKRSVVWEQAKNKLRIEKALLVCLQKW
jgi:ornithine carbamoyltransferase